MTVERTLDWVPRHDPRSRLFGSVDLVGKGLRRRSVLWKPPAFLLDQGQEGACVPHAWLHEAGASPVRVDFAKTNLGPWPNDPQALAFRLYDWCRQNDEFPGDDTAGTSVLQGAKAMRMIGVVRSYRWAFGVEEVVDAILGHGPVVLGIPWKRGMYEAPGGELRPSGPTVGGHAIDAIGYDPLHRFADGAVAEAIALLNSWGPGWGVNGVAWIRKHDLGALLADRGEACVPLQRSYARARARSLLLRSAYAVVR